MFDRATIALGIGPHSSFSYFFVLVIEIITFIFCSSVQHTTIILKYLNINPTSSNNLTLHLTLLNN